jgi:pyridinium-3,5-bisthiocarboxylic acid mononucleotide nickel chelatase
MRIAYFDCFSGASGDMLLGALVDAGLPLAALEAELRRLPVAGWAIAAEKTKKKGIAATQIRVQSGEHHPHRGLGEILRLIDEGAKAGLPPRAAALAARIFTRLGEAEAKIHNTTTEKIHFHEVGAVDAIVDIVGAAIGFEMLGIEEFFCSPLNVGAGRIEAAHGSLPVPAPATAELLLGAPTYSTGIERELVTPTGAAIITTVARKFGPMPPMTVAKIGYGSGTADIPTQANVLRMFVGEAVASVSGESVAWDETISVIEANFDDLNPQVYAYFAEKALEAGALDVFCAAIQMKKGRPGQLVTLLAPPDLCEALVDLIFRETTTIGVRSYEARRRTLAREFVSVETPLGAVRIKVARSNGHILNAAPEYEDCRRIAAERGVPLKQVLAEASFAFEKRKGGRD